MKFCTQCGTQVPDNAVFCSHCGNTFQSQAAPAPAPTQMPARTTPIPAPMPVRTAPVQSYNASTSYQPYGAPAGYAPAPQPFAYPVTPLKTDRSLAMFILLSLITFGIYGLVVMCSISTDIDTIAQRYDRKTTMHYALVVFIFSWLTLGIYPIVWYHTLSNRIGCELKRRGIPFEFSAGTFWGWGVLGALILVGPFIYVHRLLKSMNLLSEDYNRRGC